MPVFFTQKNGLRSFEEARIEARLAWILCYGRVSRHAYGLSPAGGGERHTVYRASLKIPACRAFNHRISRRMFFRA